MKSKKYLSTAAVIYLSYLIHGIALIILSQNITQLQVQMNTDYAGIMFVVSGLGIGKLVTQYLGGVWSDKIGRRPFMFLSVALYAIFFLGILISPNIYVGFLFSFLCGVGNTCLDAGGTTTLMEIMDKMMGTASILTKLFIAAGQFIFPILISFITVRQLYYGTSFIVCAGMLLLLGIALFGVPFIPVKKDKTENAAQTVITPSRKSNMKIEGAALIVIGYTSTATFYTIINWITIYARDVAGFSDTVAASLLSFYSIGAVASVSITAVLVQKFIKPVRLLIIDPLLATIAISVLLLFPSEGVCRAAAFFIGCFAGGGVLQLAAAVIVEFFPERKGKMTGMIFTTSGLAMFLGSNITGWLSGFSVSYVMMYDIFVTILGVALAVLVNIRYNQVMGIEKEVKAVEAKLTKAVQ